MRNVHIAVRGDSRILLCSFINLITKNTMPNLEALKSFIGETVGFHPLLDEMITDLEMMEASNSVSVKQIETSFEASDLTM